MKTYTRKQYMNKECTHHEFYAQFVTDETNRFILNSLTVEQIKSALDSGDEHLNEIKIPYNNMGSGGKWWWDDSPLNLQLARELGAVSQGCSPSQSTRTCVGKAAAGMLANELEKQV